MPIYEYKCTACNTEFETLIFGGQETVACPQCQGNNVKRLMSACGFKSDEGFTPSSGSSGCSTCSSSNCSSCH
ncbi:MAG: zinc ribbon domain-containing protein [Desulfatiglandaceae bacterium]